MDLMTRRRALLARVESGESRAYLYNSGVIEPITGGFDTAKQLWVSQYPWVAPVLESDYINMNFTSNHETILGTLSNIDLTPYQYLCADVYINETYLDYLAVRLAVFNQPRFYWNEALAKTPDKGGVLGEQIIKIDVSNINQAAYISAATGGMNYRYNLFKLWLE